MLNGGTELIDSPRPYSKVAAGLLGDLGIDPVKLTAECDRDEVYKDLSPSIWFDKETFGKDALVVGQGRGGDEGKMPWKDFLAQCPLDAQTQADILRVVEGEEDVMPGLTSDQKKDKLSRISYRDYLKDYLKVNDTTLAFFQTITHDEYGTGIDAEPALDCWGFGIPGFKGLKLAPGSTDWATAHTDDAIAARGSPVRQRFGDRIVAISALDDDDASVFTYAVTQAEARARSRKTPRPVALARTFSDGTWEVGAEVKPGTYRATADAGCSWARLGEPEPELGESS